MSRREPLNRKPPKRVGETKGKVTRFLVLGLALLVVLGVFLHYVYPPELPDSAVLQLRGGGTVTLSRADARQVFRSMGLLRADRDAPTFRMEGAYWLTFYQGDKAVGELAVGPGDVVMFVNIGGYSHMKKPGLGIDYAAMEALYTSYGGK